MNSTDRYPLSCLMKTLNTNASQLASNQSRSTRNSEKKSRKDVSTSGESQAPEPSRLRNRESSIISSARVIEEELNE